LTALGNEALAPPALLAPDAEDAALVRNDLVAPGVAERMENKLQAWLAAFHIGNDYQNMRGVAHIGKGPFQVQPCDVVISGDYRIEIYQRQRGKGIRRLKARIFRGDEYLGTIMAGPDTTPERDQKYQATQGDTFTLRGFQSNPLSGIFEIE
jgi:hypothetical protein